MTDEDGFLSCSMMIKAKNTMKERIWINRVAQRDHVFSSCVQTLYCCTMSVSLQFERNAVCTLSHTSEMSQLESSRCILNRYVERFFVEKCPMRYESIGRHTRAAVTQMFGRIDKATGNVWERSFGLTPCADAQTLCQIMLLSVSLCLCDSRLQQSAHRVICLYVLSQS